MTRGATDSGLQAERTALSWRRTAVALLGATALVARVTVEHHAVTSAALGALGAMTATSLVVVSGTRLRKTQVRLRRSEDETGSTDHGLLLVAALCTSALGTTGVLAVMTASS